MTNHNASQDDDQAQTIEYDIEFYSNYSIITDLDNGDQVILTKELLLEILDCMNNNLN